MTNSTSLLAHLRTYILRLIADLSLEELNTIPPHNIEGAINFLPFFHEGLHVGCIKALKQIFF